MGAGRLRLRTLAAVTVVTREFHEVLERSLLDHLEEGKSVTA